jgi:hypothetical protein
MSQNAVRTHAPGIVLPEHEPAGGQASCPLPPTWLRTIRLQLVGRTWQTPGCQTGRFGSSKHGDALPRLKSSWKLRQAQLVRSTRSLNRRFASETPYRRSVELRLPNMRSSTGSGKNGAKLASSAAASDTANILLCLDRGPANKRVSRACHAHFRRPASIILHAVVNTVPAWRSLQASCRDLLCPSNSRSELEIVRCIVMPGSTDKSRLRMPAVPSTGQWPAAAAAGKPGYGDVRAAHACILKHACTHSSIHSRRNTWEWVRQGLGGLQVPQRRVGLSCPIRSTGARQRGGLTEKMQLSNSLTVLGPCSVASQCAGDCSWAA